jgi:hypothetical protein
LAFGKRWRLCSIVTLLVVLGSGALTAPDVPLVQANLPTPWHGVKERLSIGAYLLWLAALGIALLRAQLNGAEELGGVEP